MLEYWLRLIYVKGIDLSQKRLLLDALGSPQAVLDASTTQLIEIFHRHSGEQDDRHQAQGQAAKKLLAKSYSLAINLAIKHDLALLESVNAEFIGYNAAGYPPQLNHIDYAPLGLFYRGDVALLSTPQIAIVGSRLATRNGCKTAYEFASQLSHVGFTITSGLALGIDKNAHAGALSATANTIAVTATGIDQVYPARNAALHRKIVDHGVVISEFTPATPPRRQHFPQRNRIISGLCLGTMVVEAGLRSGSLITARLASEQGREVFAVPGSIYAASSRGCHLLLKQGAKLVESSNDVLEEFGADCDTNHQPQLDNQSIKQLEPSLAKIYSLLDFSACGIDQLIRLSGLTAEQVSSILIRLEMQGLVWDSGNGYQLVPPSGS